MRSIVRLALILTSAALLVPGSAQAKSFKNPKGFRLDSADLSVHEYEGRARIAVTRSDTSRRQTIHYITLGPGHPCGSATCTAEYRYDFHQVGGQITFAPGEVSKSFSIPIVDHHAATLPTTVGINLYGGGLAEPHSATLTIINDDPLTSTTTGARGVPGAPVVTLPTSANPLIPYRWFIDPERDLPRLSRRYPILRHIAAQPWVERFGRFSGSDIGVAVSRYLGRASVQQPGTVVQMATYRLVPEGSGYGHCGHWADPPVAQNSYAKFIRRFAQGIGSYHTVLFLEIDSVITSGRNCLTPAGTAIRERELADAISVLGSACPNLVIYVDGGAANALGAGQTARTLNAAGVAKAQGFFLNSTHYDWTRKEIKYGQAISRMTGGKHFVVNTAMNGQGPLVPKNRVKYGNELLCNPPGRGIGPLPTAKTGWTDADGFAWIMHPGESTNTNSPNGKPCGKGAAPTGQIWVKYLLAAAKLENLKVR